MVINLVRGAALGNRKSDFFASLLVIMPLVAPVDFRQGIIILLRQRNRLRRGDAFGVLSVQPPEFSHCRQASRPRDGRIKFVQRTIHGAE